jgi:PAS domain S-box-containing protein
LRDPIRGSKVLVMTLGRLKVLVVDDNDDDLFAINEYLSQITSYKIEGENELNYKEARRKILQDNHDIYVVDYLLGAETGLELIKECVKAGVKKPFILLTGKGDKKTDIDAAKAGVYDYLTKSELNAELLERSFRYSLERFYSYVAIEESEKRYREIFNKSNDIIFVLDSDFKLINFNPAMTAILGYNFEELIQKPIALLFENPEHAGRFLHHFESNSTGGDLEISLLTKNRSAKTFLASLTRIVSAAGLRQYQGILHDYTSIKKSVAEKLLNARIEATNKIVRSLAHEIRNPLTNINLASYQLEADIAEDKMIFTEIITRNSKKINNLITELMNLSEPPQKDMEPIEINDIFREAITSATDRLKLKGIAVSENFAPEKILIFGDKVKIQTAILNIMINAIEAMESNTGKLELGTNLAGNTAEIKISDNGAGIDPEIVPYLFQPFFTRKKNGMGLGLAIAHSVIEAHNGDIEVDSAPGKGTCFTIRLKVPEHALIESA